MNAPKNAHAPLPGGRFILPRYRVCLQSAGSDETRRVSYTNSAEDAVRDFLRTDSLADGSDLYIWDREQRQIVARIDWIDEPTIFGNTLRVRANRFFDASLVELARHLCEQPEIRRAVIQGTAMHP